MSNVKLILQDRTGASITVEVEGTQYAEHLLEVAAKRVSELAEKHGIDNRRPEKGEKGAP